MKKAKISVIMAAKNAEGTIRSAMNSCLAGLSFDDELLVFLDGCSDGTAREVSRIADHRVRVFESTLSIGRSAARNFLFGHAEGEYIAIQDADDMSFRWRFWISRRLLSKFDVVFGNAVIFGSAMRAVPFAPLYPVQIKPDLAPWVLTYRNPFVHSGAVFTRSFLDRGFRYEEIAAEEYLLWLRMATSGARMLRTRLPLVAYRLHKGQVTSSPGFKNEVENCQELTTAKETLRQKLANRAGIIANAHLHDDFYRHHVYSRSRMMWFEENFLRTLLSFYQTLKGRLRKFWRSRS